MASGLVWTKHLEERLRGRGISRNEAWETVRYPEQSIKLGANKYKQFRRFSHKQVVIVAVYEQGQWIILTAWSKPLPGSSRAKSTSEESWLSGIVRRLLFGGGSRNN
jgi:hypothetical protein